MDSFLMQTEILGTIDFRSARLILVGKIHHIPADVLLVQQHEVVGGKDELPPFRVDQEGFQDVGEQVVVQREPVQFIAYQDLLVLHHGIKQGRESVHAVGSVRLIHI